MTSSKDSVCVIGAGPSGLAVCKALGEAGIAYECLEAGLALEVLPDDQLLDRVNEQASKLASLPLSSVMKTKEVMMAPHKAGLKANIIKENEGLDELKGSPANIEAITAFMQKREPDFSKTD